MKCKSCGSWNWDLVWPLALKEEGVEVHLWQGSGCKRLIMCGDDLGRSGEIV